jgi:hypothetical protein
MRKNTTDSLSEKKSRCYIAPHSEIMRIDFIYCPWGPSPCPPGLPSDGTTPYQISYNTDNQCFKIGTIIRSRISGKFFPNLAPFHINYVYPENLKSRLMWYLKKKIWQKNGDLQTTDVTSMP